ncbi:MAG: family 43 glycosylhydrolase [Planctomycetales bacterium]|nr:family 43 glycosylhydrolase [Planctomycetales bacterium]
MNTRIPLAFLLCLGALVSGACADYPIVSNRYLADPSCLVTVDRVYLYCSNDDESPVEGSYNIPNVVCVSSSDMKNWTDHGSVFRAADSTIWAKKTWAPAAIERDGKHFLYFGNGGADIGVAVGDSPTGPFTEPLGRNLINHGTPGVQPAQRMWLFDPGVFIDDDGQAYIYFGGNGDDNVRAAKLGRDMISLDGDVIKMSAPNFFEAAWVFKHNGKYYFTYSTTPRAQMRIDYMMSDDPIKGFTYGGIVADQPPINNDNNHAAQFSFKGRWYHAYHNRIVAKEAGIPTGFRRNIAVEEMSFNNDGTIQKVEYTQNGVEQIAPVDPYARVEAETFHSQGGIETEPSSAGGMMLVSLDDGDWVKIVGVDFGAPGAKRFTASVASAGSGGAIELRASSADGQLLGVLPIEATGGADQWQTASCEVVGATGTMDLVLKFTRDAQPTFAVDHWSFETDPKSLAPEFAAAQDQHKPIERTDPNSVTVHKQLLEKLKQGEIDVYFEGDSITRRWGATDYPEYLAHWNKNFHGWNAANFAWGGDNTHNILWRLRNGELDGVEPKVVVLQAGTNNLPWQGPASDAIVQDVTTGIKAIIAEFQSRVPEAKIILTGVFARPQNPPAAPEIKQINQQLERLADGDHIRLININSKLVDDNGAARPGVFSDGLHLAVPGYEAWAG